MERSLLVAKGFCEVEIVAALRERGGRREHDGDGGARTPLSPPGCWSHGCVLFVNIQLYSDGYFSICIFYCIKKLFKKRNGKNC